MRVERLAARNYFNGVVAEEMVQVALCRAMEMITVNTLGYCYPDFRRNNFSGYSDVSNAACSRGGVSDCPDLLTGEATNFIPLFAAANALKVAPDCDWQEVINLSANTQLDATQRKVNGRIAWIAMDCGGLLDANIVGGTPPNETGCRMSPAEIDLTSLNDFKNLASVTNFFTRRQNKDKRYETVAELETLCENEVSSVSNLFVFSYDPDPDVIFGSTLTADYVNSRSLLGNANVPLQRKFNINSITNYACYSNAGNNIRAYAEDADFMANYYNVLIAIMDQAGMKITGGVTQMHHMMWRLINYLDPDKVDNCRNTNPYADYNKWWLNPPDGGIYLDRWNGEPTPTINELVFNQVVTGPPTNEYEFSVEVWYPFTGVDVVPEDQFTHDFRAWPYDPGNNAYNSIAPYDPWHFTNDIPNMKFGTATEYLVFTSPEDKRVKTTNDLSAGGTSIWCKAIIMMKGNPVEASHGWTNYEDDTPHTFATFSAGPACLETVYPLYNQSYYHWSSYTWGQWPVSSNTLGSLNHTHKQAFDGKREGYPFFVRNGPMESIGELSHLVASSYGITSEDSGLVGYPGAWVGSYWTKVNLMQREEGVRLLDFLTVHESTDETRTKGRVCINTPNREVLYSLFHNLAESTNVTGLSEQYAYDSDKIDALVDTIMANQGKYICWYDMFDQGYTEAMSDAFRECGQPDAAGVSNSAFCQSAIRNICELVSFRQNMFTLILGGQALGPDKQSVVGEKRAVAVVYRDSYTGRFFVRQFKWLND